MIKKVYFVGLLLGSLTAAAMEMNDDLTNKAADTGNNSSEEPETGEVDEYSDAEILSLEELEDGNFAYVLDSGKEILVKGRDVLVGLACGAIKLGIRYPRLTKFGVGCLLFGAAAAASNFTCKDCAVCNCECNNGAFGVGKAPDILVCMQVCKEIGKTFFTCR